MQGKVTAPRLNRLALEASPYLRQHGANPVDWFPWGDEALTLARKTDKPILLSVGYAACHWCHVMERESFEDDAIAALMNEHFVCIKVDREERPDLDQIYQVVVQLMGQGGGWPLTVFLTPDERPFYGGTYFPPADKYGRPGFPRVLAALAEAYRERRSEITGQADELTRAITRVTQDVTQDVTQGVTRDVGGEAGASAALTSEALGAAAARVAKNFDDEHGGFGHRPKFPNTMALDILLRRAVDERDAGAERRVRLALDGMRAGGIWDQLGGGFHRYSTDEAWLVPHFEKMLYDNALLLRLYADAFRSFGDERYRQTSLDIAAYLEREMTDAGGAFYSSQDADSEGEEGRYFVWSRGEVAALLVGDADAFRVLEAFFGLTEEGNFEESGTCVLHEARSIGAVAEELGLDDSVARAALERGKVALLRARAARVRPLRDDKILASWNALLIGALAGASRTLAAPKLLAMAERAFAFVERELLVAVGERLRPRRLSMDGQGKGQGFLDDVGFLACAALDLYGATGAPRYVDVATRIVRGGLAHFHDGEHGDFFFTPDDAPALLVRAKDPFDHAIPSGVSMLTSALLRLEALTGEDASRARVALERLAPMALKQPLGMSQTVNVLSAMVSGFTEIVIVGRRASPEAQALADAAFRSPGDAGARVVAWLDPDDPETRAACRALADGKGGGPVAAAYVCRGRACSAPVSAPADLRALLAG